MLGGHVLCACDYVSSAASTPQVCPLCLAGALVGIREWHEELCSSERGGWRVAVEAGRGGLANMCCVACLLLARSADQNHSASPARVW